jgi:DNA-binding GntR family transcriptional regulator
LPKSKQKKNKKKQADHTQIACDGIRRMLFHNEIAPGQKISYRFIAEKLGMSYTPVIQALNRLEYQGLVRHERNCGYFTDPISLQEIREIYELREAVEISLLPTILKNISDGQIDQLKCLIDDAALESNFGNLNKRLMRDREFHLTLASFSGCKIQLQVLKNLYDLLYLRYRGSLLFVTSKEIVGSEHQNILNALITRDIKKSQEALQNHFNHIKKKALEAFSQMIDEAEMIDI